MSTKQLRAPDFVADLEVSPASNVVDFHQRILPRHLAALNRWVAAGQSMGLCSASSFQGGDEVCPGSYILVWVRENADPAYLVTPDGTRWVVRDCVRDQLLGRMRSFEEALAFIRPVLPASA